MTKARFTCNRKESMAFRRATAASGCWCGSRSREPLLAVLLQDFHRQKHVGEADPSVPGCPLPSPMGHCCVTPKSSRVGNFIPQFKWWQCLEVEFGGGERVGGS